MAARETMGYRTWLSLHAENTNEHHPQISKKCCRCCNALSSKYSIYLESFCRHKIATIGDKMFEMLSYIYTGVFFRNHNKQRPLPPPFGQCLVDYCFPWASWVGVQHWKGERRGLGQPGKGYCWKLFWTILIRKSLKHGHLCHFSQKCLNKFCCELWCD